MTSPNLQSTRGPGRIEFILLISVVMMIVALAIDSMLPALPAIGQSLGMDDPTRYPLVISSFLLGFGISQIFVGTLTDRYGRRGLLLWSLFGFAVTSLAASLAPSFELLLLARLAQGLACAGGRVVIQSVVRDRFAGREMAQVMSLASMIFMAAPILAPAMGQLILMAGSWRLIFGVLSVIGVLVWAWILTRLPETIADENVTRISWTSISANAKTVIFDRMSLGYALAMTAVSCSLFGFLMSVQQIFDKTFGQAAFLPIGFAIMSSGMAAASLINALIVKRYGMRKIGHAALFFFTITAGLHMLVSQSGHETMTIFIVLQTLMMMGFSLMAGNFGAMAMENMGKVAGMASSLQGSISSIVASFIGALIGGSFDGTTFPMYLGYFLCGCAALIIIFITERGQFFVARNTPEFAE